MSEFNTTHLSDVDPSVYVDMYIDQFYLEDHVITSYVLIKLTAEVNKKLHGEKRKDYEWTNQIVQLTKGDTDLGNIIIANALMKEFLKENKSLSFNRLVELKTHYFKAFKKR